MAAHVSNSSPPPTIKGQGHAVIKCATAGVYDCLGFYTLQFVYALRLQVLGISHLSRDLKHCDEFIACGREALPLEIQQQQFTEHPASSASGPPPAAAAAAVGGGGAGASRRRAQTPYHQQALQGINADDTGYQRLNKGATIATFGLTTL